MKYPKITDYEDKDQIILLATTVIQELINNGSDKHLLAIISGLIEDLDENEIVNWTSEFEMIATDLQHNDPRI